MKQPQSSRSPSSPPLVTRVRGQLGTILLLGCKGGQNVPQYRPRAVSHDFHPLTFQYGKIPNPCKSTVLSIHGVAVRKETGGGNPSTRGPGDQVTPQSPGIRRAHHPLSALCLALLSEDPPWSHVEGPGTMGPRGFLSWQILSIPLGPAFQLNLVQALGMVPPALTTQARGDYSRRYSFYDIFILVSSAVQLIYKVAFVLANSVTDRSPSTCFWTLLPDSFFQSIELSSLCWTVGPCWLF